MLFLFFVFQFIESRNYAIFINTSMGYNNYRHSGNVYLFNELFEKRGFKKDQILIVQRQNIIINERNPLNRFLFSKNKNETRYFETDGVPLDGDYILDILDLKCNELKHLDEYDNLFIYICGHGRNSYLRLCNMYFLFRNDIMDKIQKLSKRLNKLFIVFDTCEAETLLKREEIPDNVFVLTTSLKDMKSYSIYPSPIIGVAACDSFPCGFMKKKLNDEMLLFDLLKQFDFTETESTLTFCNKKNFLVKDFFTNNEEDQEKKVKQFVL